MKDIINSNIGWYNFNQLMNNLREAVATLGKQILPTSFTSYTIEASSQFSLSGESDSTIIGIYRDEMDINIRIQDSQGESNDFDLLFQGFHPDDFLHLLKHLENEHNS